MPKPPTPKTKVLFVDDDHGFLLMVNEVFGQLGKDTWEIHEATDAEGALKILHEQSMDLVVLDLLMPGVGGMDLLKIIDRDFPNLQKVFLTGGADEKARISGLESGADLFLEKPANLAGLESVFATLNQLARWQQKTIARGSLRPAGLLDIIRMECASGNSRLLDVSFDNIKGQIYVKAGVIVHAETEGRRGQSAFSFLASRREAEFSLKQFVEPPERSVDRQWEFLVMEAFHLQERAEKAGEPKKGKRCSCQSSCGGRSAADGSGTGCRARASGEARRVGPSRARPGAGSGASASVPGGTRNRPSRPRARARGGHQNRSRSRAGVARGKRQSRRGQPPLRSSWELRFGRGDLRVEETLVCSKQREVLDEAGITQGDARLRLLTFVAEECGKASEGMPSGKLERVELQATDGRIVLRFQENTDILIRTNTAERRSSPATARPKPTVDKWVDGIMEAPGILGAGITRPDLTVRNIPCYTDYTEERLNRVWRWIGELFRMLNQDRVTAWQLRLVFETAQVYCVKRLDRFVFSVLASKDPQELDAARVQEIFTDFDNLGSI